MANSDNKKSDSASKNPNSNPNGRMAKQTKSIQNAVNYNGGRIALLDGFNGGMAKMRYAFQFAINTGISSNTEKRYLLTCLTLEGTRRGKHLLY